MKRDSNKKSAAAKKYFETKTALAAIKIAEKKTWSKISLDEVAAAAKVTKSFVKKRYSETNDLLPAIVRYVDNALEKSLSRIDSKSPPRERLFDVIMNRLDILQTHRKGFLSIFDACMSHPQTGIVFFRPLMTSMQHMLRLARMDEKGAISPVKIMGLLLLYHAVIFRWKTDDSADMNRTMAMVNSGLSLCEKIFHPHHKEPH